MALDANGNFIPPSVSGYFPGDLYNTGVSGARGEGQQLQARYTTRVVKRVPEGVIVHFQVTLEDTRGGLNVIEGRFDEDFDRVQASSADTRFYRTLILPQLTTDASTPDPGGTLVGLHSVNFNSLLHFGIGATADNALFAETSATNPVVAAVTYTPTSSITMLSTVAAGAANAALRMAVGHSAVAQVVRLLDTSYSSTSMHADTGRCWGMIQTFINNNTLLIYSQGAIRYLDSTVAVTTQPTVGLSNVPNGGFALGMAKLAGAPVRPYWVWPLAENTSGMLLSSAEAPGRVVSTNQEGTDYQHIPMGLKYVFSACIVNGNGIVASDKERIMYYDGRSGARDLGWTSARAPDSDFVYECRGLASNGNEVWARVNFKTISGGTGETTGWWEVYNLENNSWHRVSSPHTYGSTGTYGNLPGGALPISETTGFIHDYSDGSWRRMFVPVYGYNPFSTYRHTVGAEVAAGGYEYNLAANVTWPEYELPGLEGWPKIISRILFMGNVDAGGTDATAGYVTWTAGNMSATFGTGLSGRAQLVDTTDNGDVFYKFQPLCTLSRTTASSRYTPNALPVMFEGFAFVGNPDAPTSWYQDVR